MKRFLAPVAVLAALLVAGSTSLVSAAGSGFADPVDMPGAITGTMQIDFGTRVDTDTTGKVPEGSPVLGAVDTYTTDLKILDSLLLQGKIIRQPWLPTAKLGLTAQNGFVDYNLKWVLQNPSNPSQKITLGGLIGAMKLDGGGKYYLSESPEGKGNLRIATDTIKTITGFTDNFNGQIQGRVPSQAGLWGMASRAASKVSKTYVRYVNGKVVKSVVKDADPMAFQNVTLAMGPLNGYAATRFSGSIDYDPENGIWYLDASATYTVNGNAIRDRLSGTIRWTEDPNRAKNGLGQYEVNVRLNEKPASEADIFASADTSTEDAFFSSDTSVPGFTGTIAYVDSFGNDGETTVSSKITYKVDAHQASKIQTMNFAKILLLMIGPFNDD